LFLPKLSLLIRLEQNGLSLDDVAGEQTQRTIFVEVSSSGQWKNEATDVPRPTFSDPIVQ